MSGATDTTPPPLCSHLRGYLLAPPTTGYQPIWRCHQCGHDIRLEDLPGAWAKTLQVLSQRISDLEAYWNQKINLSEDLNDGR